MNSRVSGSQTPPSTAEGADVKIYDFKKALRLSIDQVRVLERIHESFAYQLSSSISSEIRSNVQVEVQSVEQMMYEEFINQLPSTTILSVFEADGQDIRMVMDMSPKMAFMMIDRLLGGQGWIDESNRTSLTPIESKVLTRLVEGIIQILQKAWNDIIQLQLRVLNLETNPQFLQLMIPTETVIVLSFQLTVGKMTEAMHLCIPYILLEPFIPQLSSHNWFGHGQSLKNREETDFLQGRIENLTVPLITELGRATITIEEFLGLAVNDVIQLDQLVDDPLKIKVNEQIKFLARPGTKKSRLAVKLDQVVEGVTIDE